MRGRSGIDISGHSPENGGGLGLVAAGAAARDAWKISWSLLEPLVYMSVSDLTSGSHLCTLAVKAVPEMRPDFMLRWGSSEMRLPAPSPGLRVVAPQWGAATPHLVGVHRAVGAGSSLCAAASVREGR